MKTFTVTSKFALEVETGNVRVQDMHKATIMILTDSADVIAGQFRDDIIDELDVAIHVDTNTNEVSICDTKPLSVTPKQTATLKHIAIWVNGFLAATFTYENNGYAVSKDRVFSFQLDSVLFKLPNAKETSYSLADYISEFKQQEEG